ncbi:MAG TPA: GNAT family N-acetyltransferase [Candidatus Nitrosocosmicus sp.]|nr:GNAT family N-acetyltransferase [Candidatus Nitrosocosmicus sp.]
MDVKHRIVTPNDWLFILDIRNEEDVRNASFNTEIIDRDRHIEYMNKLENMKDVYQRIITYNNKDAGYIKVIDNEVSYMIKKEFRGKGIMKSSFEILFKDLKRLGNTKINASIKAENYASLRLAEKMGYKITKITYKNNKPYSYMLEKHL